MIHDTEPFRTSGVSPETRREDDLGNTVETFRHTESLNGAGTPPHPITELRIKAGASRGATNYPITVAARLSADAAAIMTRYPQPRSALLPLLHLVQSEDGYLTDAGIRFCADQLNLTCAEVAAVATFYSMYRRTPTGDYLVGVCTNTLCAIMGGDEILARLSEYLDVAPGETTPDGRITLEHVECNAACDYAPVMMINWEFFDNQTPESARALIDALRAGETVTPTRGAPLCRFRDTARMLAGFPDPRPETGRNNGPATVAGLRVHTSGIESQASEDPPPAIIDDDRRQTPRPAEEVDPG